MYSNMQDSISFIMNNIYTLKVYILYYLFFIFSESNQRINVLSSNVLHEIGHFLFK
jgi:hypothetical protein